MVEQDSALSTRSEKASKEGNFAFFHAIKNSGLPMLVTLTLNLRLPKVHTW